MIESALGWKTSDSQYLVGRLMIESALARKTGDRVNTWWED